jgi:predicted transposase YdaD
MIFGIRGIEESTVYQGIFRRGEAKGRAEGYAKGYAEGLVEGIRRSLLRQGLKKLGPPGEEVEARLAALDDIDRL